MTAQPHCYASTVYTEFAMRVVVLRRRYLVQFYSDLNLILALSSRAALETHWPLLCRLLR
jgi:hypothetical protein